MSDDIDIIRGSGNVFRNNLIHDNVGVGVRLGGDTTTDGIDNAVYGNDIHDSQSGGIKFQRSPQGQICANRMVNNPGGNAVGTFGSNFTPWSRARAGQERTRRHRQPPPA